MLQSLKKHTKEFFRKDNQLKDIDALVQEHKNLLKIADIIPLVEMLDDEMTIYTKNFGLVQVIKLQGMDYSGVSSDHRNNYFNVRKTSFDSVPAGIELGFYYFRKKLFSKTEQLKKLSFKNKYAKTINEKWQKNFINAYKTEIYLVLRYQIPIDFKKLINPLAKNFDISEKLINHIDKINSARDIMSTKLSIYKPEVLKNEELINFWSYIINCSELDNLIGQKKDIGNSISLTEINFNRKKRLISLSNSKGRRYARILTLKSIANKTTDIVLSSLMNLKHEFMVVQKIIPIYKERTKAEIDKRLKNTQGLGGAGFTDLRLLDLQEAGEAVEANQVVMSAYSINILVLGDSEQDLQIAERDIEANLASNQISVLTESMIMSTNFWSIFPDYYRKSGRELMVTTENLADFITLGSSHEGIGECSFGKEPIALFKTDSFTNYSFTFHQSAEQNVVGHTLIIGGTGTGKTTLIEFLLMNCLKYEKLRMLAFDSLKGLKIFSSVFDGKYINVGEDRGLKLNPMLLKETNRNKGFLMQWLEMLIGSINEEEREIITTAVQRNFELNPQERNLTILRALGSVSDKGRTSIAKRLARWLPDSEDPTKSDHPFGLLFNAKSDNLNFNNSIVSFGMDQVLGNQDVLGALSTYIFHCFNEYITTNPSPNILFIDEMGRYIDNKLFQPIIKQSFQEMRKRNGVIIGAVQQPSSILDSPIGKAVIANTATYLIYPDSNANPTEYIGATEENQNINGLGLNDAEFHWVKYSNVSRKVMLKRKGGESVILDVDLACLKKHLKLFSSNNEDVKQFEKLSKTGDENFVDEFISNN